MDIPCVDLAFGLGAHLAELVDAEPGNLGGSIQCYGIWK